MAKEIFEAVDAYIDALFVQEDEALKGAVRAAEEAEMPPIQVSPGQGKLLYLLAKMCGARRILEIGTLAGYSTIWLARALPDDGRLISLELVEKHAEVARGNVARAGLADRVSILQGPALESLARLASEQAAFDLFFIDADKPGYSAYLEAVLPLCHAGSVIIADNVVRAGMVLGEDTDDAMAVGAREFNKAFASHPRVEAVVMQQVGAKGHDGMAIGIVKD